MQVLRDITNQYLIKIISNVSTWVWRPMCYLEWKGGKGNKEDGVHSSKLNNPKRIMPKWCSEGRSNACGRRKEQRQVKSNMNEARRKKKDGQTRTYEFLKLKTKPNGRRNQEAWPPHLRWRGLGNVWIWFFFFKFTNVHHKSYCWIPNHSF